MCSLIESLTIWIPSRPNSSLISVRFNNQWRIWADDRDFDLKWIYFWLKSITFDLFSIKRSKRQSKCRLYNRKRQFISKMTIYIKNNDQYNDFQSNSTNFWYKSNFFDTNGPDIEFGIKIEHGFWIVMMISLDFSNNFGSKKSIKSQFDHNLKWNLAGGPLDRISLHTTRVFGFLHHFY